jgi:IS5 family transposase
LGIDDQESAEGILGGARFVEGPNVGRTLERGDLGSAMRPKIQLSGYRGHNASPEYQFKVYTAGQKRRITPQIKRDMRRRAAVEPVIGHLKEDHRMGRNYLAHSSGDAINAVPAAVGYNFRLLLRWLRLLLFRILTAIVGTSQFRFS